MTVFYVLLAILMLAILIVVHELGHYTAARLMKIEVREFAVGFGPKILGWKSKKYETDFSLRAIPLGGFCAFYGEDDPTGESKDDPRAFSKQNVWKRMFTILMGPVMNFVLAFVVAACFYLIGGVQTVTGVDPYIVSVTASGPAHDAGMKDGDIITRVNGTDVLDGTTDTLIGMIDSWREGDDPLDITVLRGDETLQMELTPYFDEEENKMRIGVIIGGRYRTETVRVGPLEAIAGSWQYCVYAGGTIFEALGNLVTKGEGLDQTSGPVGVISLVTEQVQEYGFEMYIQLLVVISINLGIMNLLPIPGLDGSRLIFGIIEVIRGKPVPPEKEAIVHLCGMALLFGLMIFFTFKDIIRLFN
ncbi:MAG: RIP metalloprotease RseP [Clostridia bacterium]|nr:RIP metalloprotease RseP [Clostridia bacterium]